MCWDDIKIARLTTSNRLSTSLTTTAKALAGHAPDRFALILCAPSSGTITWSTEASVANGEGIAIAAGGAPVILKLTDVGDLVRRQWFGIMSAGTVTIHWYETFLPFTDFRTRT